MAPPPAFDTSAAGFSFGGADMSVPTLLAEFDGWAGNAISVEGTSAPLEELKARLKPICDSLAALEWDLRNYIPPLPADQLRAVPVRVAHSS